MSLTMGIGPLSRRAEAGQLDATIGGPTRRGQQRVEVEVGPGTETLPGRAR